MLLHHATLVRAAKNQVTDSCQFVEETLGISMVGNPDFFLHEEEVLLIDLVREVNRRARQRNVRNQSVFVLFFHSATLEAQNALLKLLEEPAEGTYIVLVTPFPDTLLATVRSRVQQVDLPHAATSPSGFLDLSPAKRLAYLAPLLETKDIAALHALLDSVERELAAQDLREVSHKLTSLFALRTYLQGRSPSSKQLFEYLALSM